MVPVIDLRGSDADIARAIDAACRSVGFFSVVGHGVDADRARQLDAAARAFFARPDDEKAGIAMARGGRAWRGWFPLGGELTSGRPDRKEGIYFGAELPPDERPLHGPNQYPAALPELRAVLLPYLDAMTELGHRIMRNVALGLGLEDGWFDDHLTHDPLVLFRIFRYPPEEAPDANWGVAEHTDYGLLTILRQDDLGGLEVHAPSGWIEAPPIPGTFVCNLGDMLERMTGGRYRSTPHRVRNRSREDRLSFPFFFDPAWEAEVLPVPALGEDPTPEARARWDGEDLFAFEGTYGDYLWRKVGKVFPALRER